VDPRAGLERCGISRLTPGFDPRTVQPVASRYTDYATQPTDKVWYDPYKKHGITEHINSRFEWHPTCPLRHEIIMRDTALHWL
jgi:hypothetical protein